MGNAIVAMIIEAIGYGLAAGLLAGLLFAGVLIGYGLATGNP